MGLHSPKILSDESINWGLVCTHMHSIKWTWKILTFTSSLMGECWEQTHTKHASSIKTECDYLYGWIKKILKKWLHTLKSHQKWWTPEIKLGTQKKKKQTPFHYHQRAICLLRLLCLLMNNSTEYLDWLVTITKYLWIIPYQHTVPEVH